MHQYKTAVEDDGLATYLISGDWQNPDQVKQMIIKTYQECPSLEGLVLIGDVPVALVRNAQHMTTAFKMNEKAFPWDQSSVPTDRFYDDLNQARLSKSSAFLLQIDGRQSPAAKSYFLFGSYQVSGKKGRG